MKKDDLVLVGHLQVSDEPMSSLYNDKVSGIYYLVIKTYQVNNNETYLLSEVYPSLIIDYMEGRIGLLQIFNTRQTYSYNRQEGDFRLDYFRGIAPTIATSMIRKEGLSDMFDSRLGYKSLALKRYLRTLI